MRKKDSNALLAVFIVIALSICGICGKCGKSVDNQVSVSPTPNSYGTPSAAPTLESLPPPRATPKPKNLTAKNSAAAKLAIIISENANLRDSSSRGGNVLETIAKDTNVEIVKQKGGWFFVKTSTAKGWLHGNTIRFADNNTETDNSLTAESASPESYADPSADSSINSYPSSDYSSPGYGSGSSYSGYRPKTVHVRSYFRKDGTYVRSHYRSAPRRRR
jgi:hypothetical protein